jgi:hypothetical protein
VCVRARLFSLAPVKSGSYDPWSDINDDGKINMIDIGTVASQFNTLGNATKNVTVTNWPEQQPKSKVLWCGDWEILGGGIGRIGEIPVIYLGDYTTMTVRTR